MMATTTSVPAHASTQANVSHPSTRKEEIEKHHAAKSTEALLMMYSQSLHEYTLKLWMDSRRAAEEKSREKAGRRKQIGDGLKRKALQNAPSLGIVISMGGHIMPKSTSAPMHPSLPTSLTTPGRLGRNAAPATLLPYFDEFVDIS
ncbi:hypothetical protein JAAARDRAFT_29154 [Jaapia argillacea MUCL 33604]|uniref:Uncharacterized protein n=1 Tax=Jaapia argillacea MUCL 33604 TaxID=933084 RepID=A0A067Q7Y0_9AGAM|nr:hypothetical protein JAAARDRAFT_29154 [Jaapia argillacea MUCL 33604]